MLAPANPAAAEHPASAAAAATATAFFARLNQLLTSTVVTDGDGQVLDVDAGSDAAVKVLQAAQAQRSKVLTLGNGGSCVIAEHIAVDLSNRAAIRARTCGSAPQLSALANDNRFETAYALWLKAEADPGDVVIAVSSSGKSENILNAAQAAIERSCSLITFSGFSPANKLRRLGDLNFHVDSGHYGEVEIAHEALSHYITDRCVAVSAPGSAAPADKAQTDPESDPIPTLRITQTEPANPVAAPASKR